MCSAITYAGMDTVLSTLNSEGSSVDAFMLDQRDASPKPTELGQQHACPVPRRDGESTPNFCRTGSVSRRGSSCQERPCRRPYITDALRLAFLFLDLMN